MMKRAVLLGAGFLVAVAGAAQAEVVQVQVPFAFVVNGETLPAGQYRLERSSSSPSVVLIRGEEGSRARMFVVTVPTSGQSPAGNTPVLVFTPDETHNRLIEVWESGRAGHEIPHNDGASDRIAQILVVGQRVS